MAKNLSPYRKSIWDQDARYNLDEIEFNSDERSIISRLMSVDSAKKNTPPIPIAGLLSISALAKNMPKSNVAATEHIESYISGAKGVHGAGIPTAICMLSVETAGDYPPIDEKFSAGLRKKGVITEAEQKALGGSSKRKFAKVYIEKVIPAWIKSLEGRTAQEADNYWGRGGADG